MNYKKLRTFSEIMCKGLILFLSALFFTVHLNALAAEPKSGSIGTTVVPTAVGHLVVLHVIQDSPADHKGILPGDLIIEVNGFDLKGSDFSRVVKEYLWGKAGTDVDLKILRPGKEGVTVLRLTRRELKEKPAKLPGVNTVLPPE